MSVTHRSSEDLDSFLSRVRQIYWDLFFMDIDPDALEVADDIFHGEELDDREGDLSAGEYDSIYMAIHGR